MGALDWPARLCRLQNTKELAGKTVLWLDSEHDCPVFSRPVPACVVCVGFRAVKVAVASGIANARELIEDIKAGRASYDFVEVRHDLDVHCVVYVFVNVTLATGVQVLVPSPVSYPIRCSCHGV